MKKKSHNKKAMFFFLLVLVKSSLLAQPDTGYFFKCYQTRNINFLEDEYQSSYFNFFLAEPDFQNIIVDSISYDEKMDFFEEIFANLFKRQFYYIENFANKQREFLDSTCIVTNSTRANESFYSDFCYYFDRGEGYYFVVFVNKVIINYCNLKQFDKFYLFKRRIILAEPPFYLRLSTCEKRIIENNFKKIKIYRQK